jgi:hypothetical protein
MRGARAQPMIQVHEGEARLYRDRIEVGDIGGEVKVFPLKETTAANTFKQQKFEFRFEKAQYRSVFPAVEYPDTSGRLPTRDSGKFS